MNIQSHMRPALTDLPGKLSIEAFFDWAEMREERYELVEGMVRVQPWVKRSHSLIVGNIDFILRSHLDRSRYAVHQGDFAIATGPSTIRYADVMVEPTGAPLDARMTVHAVLIVEVMSESTMHRDFGAKRMEYMALPDLITYLILAQDARLVWQWTKDGEENWQDDPVQFADGTVEIERLGVSLPIDEIYRGVVPAKAP